MVNKKGAIKLGILAAVIVLVVTLAVFVREILINKMRIDEIRKGINKEGGNV